MSNNIGDFFEGFGKLINSIKLPELTEDKISVRLYEDNSSFSLVYKFPDNTDSKIKDDLIQSNGPATVLKSIQANKVILLHPKVDTVVISNNVSAVKVVFDKEISKELLDKTGVEALLEIRAYIETLTKK